MKKKAFSMGQGHGLAGMFAGLSAPFGEEETAQVVILPVSFDKTSTYQKGSDKGPEALIEASRNLEVYDIETDSEVYKKGIYTAPTIKAKSTKEMLSESYGKVKHYIKQGKFVVTLGGEHTISYGPIQAHAEHYKKITVLQLDAHSDLLESYENNPWSHACVMARVKEIKQVEQVISVGVRSMSSLELSNLDRKNMFFAHLLDPELRWIDKVLEQLKSPVYITFDLDCFDSSLMPATGTPEPGGLFWEQAMKLLRKVANNKNVVGFDVVELCPQKGNRAPDYLAAKLVYKMLSYKFFPSKG